MKKIIGGLLGAAMLIATSLQAHAQGTLIYDQQSTIPPSTSGDYLDIQPEALTQSFVPTLSAIGFVQFEFWDIPNNGTNGATVYVNILAGSPNINSATLLGSTTAVYMQEGFGEFSPGVTNFYFSTAITLTPGQTYYLQPVVQSGDDPWDIWNPGNTYPNGQLYGSGAFFQPSTDLWFREGVVPEPSILALVGLSALLAFVFKRRSKLVVLLLFTIPVLSVHASDSIVQATADEAGLAPVTAASLPEVGTFWVMTDTLDGLIALPYPELPSDLSELPIYSVVGNEFIVDDTGGQLSSSASRMSSVQAASAAQSQAESMADLIDLIQTSTNGSNQSFQSNFTSMLDTNGLWLEASNEDGYIGLRLHNPTGDNYQLLSTSNLSDTNWDLGQILPNAYGSYADFSPIPITNSTAFFKVHHANLVMEIYNGQYAIEPNPTNSDPGQIGSFYIQNESGQTNDVTVYYSIGGTAQNGIDYSNLTGLAVITNGPDYAEIDINPIDDGLKPDQTIILTLLQNTNYLIDPAYVSATNILYANPEVYPTARGDNERGICPNTSWPFYLQGHDYLELSLTFSILTWPAHGTLDTNNMPEVIYTPTNCFEGQDSFTFTASDGQYTSTPATVTLIIADPVSAYSPTLQTCRGMSNSFSLGADNCSETLGYALLSNPAYGTLSGTAANLTYTATGTNYTGTDSFNYVVYNDCGDTATGTVAVTVGDVQLYPDPQNVMTGTNQRVAITLSAADYDDCTADTNYYTYTVTGNPTNGYLTGTPPNLTYTNNANYEGFDSFQFNVSDGVWTSSYPATVNIYVVAGPILTAESATCYPFGTAVQLDWSLDDAVSNMVQQEGLSINDFIIYRSANPGGPYTSIATNYYYTTDWISYQDDNAVAGQTNYYRVNFEFTPSGVTYGSPDSNKAAVVGQNPDDLIPPNAFWNVATNLSDPTKVVRLQAPFSSYGTNQYPNLYPLPNTYWPVATNGVYSTWTNHIALYIPSNVVLSNLQYSIAIDNVYWLYVNGADIGTGNNNGGDAVWSAFQAFPTNTLHQGTNDLVVGIQDWGGIDYFSMVVTTNTCGW
ncbi:MAG TPA: Ig-like domain-containing protein [Verrucomicrobiae bacterium]